VAAFKHRPMQETDMALDRNKYGGDGNGSDGGGKVAPRGTYELRIDEILAGGQGEGGFLTLSKKGSLLMLVVKLSIVGGPYAGIGFRHWFSVETVDDVVNTMLAGEAENQRTAARIGYHALLHAWDSAFGIRSDDHSAEAEKKREIPSYGSFAGLKFWAVVDSKYSPDGKYENNTMTKVLRPGDDDYPSPGEMQARQSTGERPAMGPRRALGDFDDEIPF
jgi:hypothetical protein